MPDDIQPTDNGTEPGAQDKQESAPGAQGESEVEQLPDWARKELAELRAEAKKRRLQLREAEITASKAEEERLKEQAKWQELAEKRGKELDALKPREEQFKRFEEAFLATLQKRIEGLPDAYKAIVPDFADPIKTSEWLDANAHLFQQRTAPNIDAGAGNIPTAKGTQVLTQSELEMAKAMGVSAETYAKRKAEIARLDRK